MMSCKTPRPIVRAPKEATDALQDADCGRRARANPTRRLHRPIVSMMRAAEEELFFARAPADIRRTQEIDPR